MKMPDHEAHMRAINSLARALKDWNERYAAKAEEAHQRRARSDEEVEDIISIFYHAGFADLARSHAFSATVATFLESVFRRCLPHVHYQCKLREDHPRTVQFAGSPESFWDPGKPKGDRTGIAARVLDILDASGLIQYFGPEFRSLLTAVYSYRNEMAHNGFEWDLAVCQKFQRSIEENGWGAWFATATSGDDPWFFTITSEFHDDCLKTCDRVVAVFEGLINGDWDYYRFHFGLKDQS